MGRLLFLLCIVMVRAGAVELPAKLELWKAEIEKTAGVEVIVAEVLFSEDGMTMTLAEGTPRARAIGAYLSREDFARQFQRMYAAMIQHRKPGEEAFIILLNGARRAEMAGYEEAVLAHELGHAWLTSKKYAAAAYQPGLAGCLAIQTGEIVQHALLREEMTRRGVEFIPFWLKSLDAAVEGMETRERPPETDRCLRVQQAAELVNVRLGLGGVEWPGRERYEAKVAKTFPEVEPTAKAIIEYMQKTDTADRKKHREAIEKVFFFLRDLAQYRTKEYML